MRCADLELPDQCDFSRNLANQIVLVAVAGDFVDRVRGTLYARPVPAAVDAATQIVHSNTVLFHSRYLSLSLSLSLAAHLLQ